MAPVPARHAALIWSLPALAALLSLLWYRRRRARRRSDSACSPDAAAAASLQEPLDAGGGKGAFVDAPQERGKVIACADPDDFGRVWEEVTVDLLRAVAEDAKRRATSCSSPAVGEPPAPLPSEQIEGSPAEVAPLPTLAEHPRGTVGVSTPDHLFTAGCADRPGSITCAHTEARETTASCVPESAFAREAVAIVSAVETAGSKQCVEEGEESEIVLLPDLVDGEKPAVEEQCFSKAVDSITTASVSQSGSRPDEVEETELDDSSSGFVEENNTSSSVSTPTGLETNDVIEESGHSRENIPQIIEEEEGKTENSVETCIALEEERSPEDTTKVEDILNKSDKEEAVVPVVDNSHLETVETDAIEEAKPNEFLEHENVVSVENACCPVVPAGTNNEESLEETNHNCKIRVDDSETRIDKEAAKEEDASGEEGPVGGSSAGETGEASRTASPVTQAAIAGEAFVEAKRSQETVSSPEQNKDDAGGKKKSKKKGKSKKNLSNSPEQRPPQEPSVGEDDRKGGRSLESSVAENVSSPGRRVELVNKEETVEKTTGNPQEDNPYDEEGGGDQHVKTEAHPEEIVAVESVLGKPGDIVQNKEVSGKKKKKRSKNQNDSPSRGIVVDTCEDKTKKERASEEKRSGKEKPKKIAVQSNHDRIAENADRRKGQDCSASEKEVGESCKKVELKEDRKEEKTEESKEVRKKKKNIKDCSEVEKEVEESCKKVEVRENTKEEKTEESKEVRKKKKNNKDCSEVEKEVEESCKKVELREDRKEEKTEESKEVRKQKNNNIDCSEVEKEVEESCKKVELREDRKEEKTEESKEVRKQKNNNIDCGASEKSKIEANRSRQEEAAETSQRRNSCSPGEEKRVTAEVEASHSQGLGGQRTPEVACEAVVSEVVMKEGTSQAAPEEERAMEVQGEGLAAAVEAVAPALGALRVDTGDSEATDSGGSAPQGPAKEGRDSANHSPAEGMLGSPRLCFSDVPSEDSSDSGKGCSDVPTPPSRTPASGSSVAGDPGDPQVYEFVLPQHLVGRLIGRHGCFVQQIKARTNASILIKRHPETARLKVCAVEGAPLDVEAALDMIRAKFPAKRYPAVSLEQVRFVAPSPLVPVLPDSLRLQLVEGISNDVIVSSLVSPAHFFLQQPTHPTFPALTRLCQCMDATYAAADAPPVPAVQAGIVVAAPVMGSWYRAEVVSVDSDADTCQVRYVDYGGYDTQENSALRQIRSDFMTLPFQAAECYLANVCPSSEDGWSPDALTVVEQLTTGQVVQAQVCGYCEDGVPAVCLYAIFGAQVVPIHQELVARGMAVWWEPTEA